MPESRKFLPKRAAVAQYYYAAAFACFLAFLSVCPDAGAGPIQTDSILSPPVPCEGKVLAADLPPSPEITPGQVPASVRPLPKPDLPGTARIPVRTPLRQLGRIDLDIDISGLLKPPPRGCLTPEQAEENVPPRPRARQ
jgi:hypothetical protein